jgi:molybdate/tungstate transport system permease protein
MTTETGRQPAGTGVADRRGRTALAVAAVVVVHALALGLAVALDRPTWYVGFALLSAAALAALRDGSPEGLVAATSASVLLVAVGFPLALFAARQVLENGGLVLDKLADPAVHRMLYLSVYAPLLAAGFALLFGTPLAYLLSRGFPGQALVESLVDLPLVVPHSVAGIVVLFGFGRGGAFPGLPVLGTLAGMVLAMAFVSAPFAVNSVREAFEGVDTRLEYASRAHGASRVGTFLRVSLPLAGRGVLTGGVLAWARAVSEFGAVAVVAYSVEFLLPGAGVVRSQHAPVFIFNTYISGSLEESGAVSAVLLGLSALIFLLVRYVAYDEGGVL